MTTEADRVLETAKDHIIAAIRELARIEDEDVSGWDGYVADYADKISKALVDLRRIRRDLR